MNLTKQQPYKKGKPARRSRGKARPATKQERLRWAAIRALGCIVAGSTPCEGRITLHHCGTGAGGRKNHNLVIPLCWGHHLGELGVDGKRLSKRGWHNVFGSEQTLLARVQRRLESEWKNESF